MKFLWQSFKEMKKHSMNILSGLGSPGEYSINNAISVLSPVTVIPDVILPTLTPWFVGKGKGIHYPSIYDNRNKR